VWWWWGGGRGAQGVVGWAREGVYMHAWACGSQLPKHPCAPKCPCARTPSRPTTRAHQGGEKSISMGGASGPSAW
jgi:hypothetical protein